MANVSVQQVLTPSLRETTLEIPDREFLVLAGPSHSGNSVLLRLIAGLDSPAGGAILIADKPVTALPPGDRDIAMLFPDDTLYPRMTVGENITCGLRLRKFPAPEIKRRLTEAASLLAVEPHLERRPRDLSPLDRHRVALARAVARQPKAFLLDDPLSLLAPADRAELRTELLRLHQHLQATMILATGDQADAMALGNRIVLMCDGAVQQIGSPSELYREPANLFAAGFLGTPPMNFVHGKLRDTAGLLLFKETGEGVIELNIGDRPAAAPFAGREVIAGIRPQDIRIFPAAGRPPAGRFQCLLEIVENLGAQTGLHLRTGAHRLLARIETPIATEEAGHRIQFEIDPATVHLFDPETTRRIAP